MKKTTKTQTQRDRFIEKARELGCDEDEARFNETLKRVVSTDPKKGSESSKKPG